MLDFESPIYLDFFFLLLFFPLIFMNLCLSSVEEGVHFRQILHSDVYFEIVIEVGTKPFQLTKISIALIMAAIFNLAPGGYVGYRNTVLA